MATRHTSERYRERSSTWALCEDVEIDDKYNKQMVGVVSSCAFNTTSGLALLHADES